MMQYDMFVWKVGWPITVKYSSIMCFLVLMSSASVVVDIVNLFCRETQQLEDEDVVWNQVRYLTTATNQEVSRANEVFRLVKLFHTLSLALAYP